jgi:CRP-like cAMP-binding protein
MATQGLDCSHCSLNADGPFAVLDDRSRAFLESAKTTHDYRPAQGIFYEGTPAEDVYCIQSGLVKLYRSDPEGRQYVLRLAGPGEPLGYESVLARFPYTSTAEALRPTRVCILPGHIVHELLVRVPDLGPRLILDLARQLKRSEDRRVALAQQSVKQRAADLLLQLAGEVKPGGRVALHLRRTEMADMIATTPETLSRVLRDLVDTGLIALTRKDLRILDHRGLKATAVRNA